MEKNNLDKLFQKKFSDFDETPDEKVWEAIEASLDKKKKKRIVPIWWQLGGVAALLAVLFYVFNPLQDNSDLLEPKITNTENPSKTKSKDGLVNDSILLDKIRLNTPQITTERSNKSDVDNLEDASDSNQPPITNNAGIRQVSKRTQVAQNNRGIDSGREGDKQQSLKKTNASIGKEPIQVAETDGSKKEPAVDKKKTIQAAETALAKNDIDTKVKSILEKEAASTKKGSSEETVAQVDEKQKEKKSIFEAIKEQENASEETFEDSPENRWAMGPAVAPVFFDAVGQGSPIHSNFAPNSKSGNLNLSYGVIVSYEVSKRLSIRSGVHKVDYGYDTNEVIFSSSLQSSTNALIDNIDYSPSSRNLVVQSKSRVSDATANSTSEFSSATTSSLEGRMVQQMGYLEVPFELNYAVLDNKFGVNIIGGISSLFLVDNAVSLESEGLVTQMGAANNVNDVNFSTNIGLGFNYQFSPNIQFNVEPIFKYQLNTFSETAGQFRPYTVGVYSGINFRF